MATVKGRDNLRASTDCLMDDKTAEQLGNLFLTPHGEWDSNSVSIVHHGIDTIKQLYESHIKLDRLEAIESLYNSKNYTIQFRSYEGIDWAITSAQRGGYRYCLNNRELGIVVMLGSIHTDPKYYGHHLKIELSPWFILDKPIDCIQKCIDEIASIFTHDFKPTGVAIHLCADVQGWAVPNDLDHKIVTRAQRIQKYSGAMELQYENHSVATVYGKGETFTFGGAGALQFSIYNKSKLIKKNQNIEEYWHKIYQTKTKLIDNPNSELIEDLIIFDKKKEVTRLEARFHHSVIEQFARGLSQDLRSFKQLSKHLTGLWSYAFNNFRLDCSPTYIDPFWQHIRDDIVFNHDKNALDYRRIYKQTDFDSPPSDRILKIIQGLLTSCYRRLKYDLDTAMQGLLKSGIWQQLLELYQRRNEWDIDYTVQDAYEDIRGDLDIKLNPLDVTFICD